MTGSFERDLLRRLFHAAVGAADPARCLPPHLPPPPAGRTLVVGAGKAAANMAKALEDAWDGPLAGLVVTRYGHAVPTRRIEVAEAGHPFPDEAGAAAAARVLAGVGGLCPEDLVICLISGGASALLTLPAGGLSLDEKQAVNRALLRSGAPISAMNCVRKRLSAIKGGRLAAAAHPARVVTLAISDVPGDDPAVIGSGPTVPDHTTRHDALGVLERYGIAVPDAVAAHLGSERSESPKPGDPVFARASFRLIATPQMSLEAAEEVAGRAGFRPVNLGDAIEGEAREVAEEHAALVRSVRSEGWPLPPPVALISGGETTVTVSGSGRGGRNVEYALALALALDGMAGVSAIAADTDGIDGMADNAGAVIGPDTLAKGRAAGLDAAVALADNDGHGFFETIGDAVVTGPTLTNVNDFRAILIG